MKDLRLTGRHSPLMVLAPGDPLLIVRNIIRWLRSRFVSRTVCAFVSTFLLLHICNVCQVRNGEC